MGLVSYIFIIVGWVSVVLFSFCYNFNITIIKEILFSFCCLANFCYFIISHWFVIIFIHKNIYFFGFFVLLSGLNYLFWDSFFFTELFFLSKVFLSLLMSLCFFIQNYINFYLISMYVYLYIMSGFISRNLDTHLLNFSQFPLEKKLNIFLLLKKFNKQKNCI